METYKGTDRHAPSGSYEPVIPVFERSKTLEHTATGIEHFGLVF